MTLNDKKIQTCGLRRKIYIPVTDALTKNLGIEGNIKFVGIFTQRYSESQTVEAIDMASLGILSRIKNLSTSKKCLKKLTQP